METDVGNGAGTDFRAEPYPDQPLDVDFSFLRVKRPVMPQRPQPQESDNKPVHWKISQLTTSKIHHAYKSLARRNVRKIHRTHPHGMEDRNLIALRLERLFQDRTIA